MTEQCDVVVVGGGFAGVTAARELSASGHSVVLLEGRNRLGGRTWYADERVGPYEHVEMGGTWVHWAQPHVWAEITRYGLGLELVESPGCAAPERVIWMADGERREAPYASVKPVLEEAMGLFCHDARELLERPYEPLAHPDITSIDALSFEDRISRLDVTVDQRNMLNAMGALAVGGYCREGGILTMLRWYALAGWDVPMLFDILTRYKLRHGTRSLIEAMAGDIRGEVRFETPVSAVEQDAEGVVVETRGGDRIRAAAVVITVPLNTLKNVRFTPGLSAAKAHEAELGQASHASKVTIHLRGELPVSLFALATEDYPFNYFQTEKLVDDGQILSGQGPDAASIDVRDVAAVQRVIEPLFPGCEVVATTGHDWLADEFSLGAWPALRPGQTARALRALQEREGRVVFAGSESADGWNGLIDGAIETGLRAAREIRALVGQREAAGVA